MNYLSNGIQERLQEAFNTYNIRLNVKPGYIIAENSKNLTEKKMIKIIKKSGFCPLISQSKVLNNYVFTIFPYQIPIFFNSPVHNSVPLHVLMEEVFAADKTRDLFKVNTALIKLSQNSNVTFQQMEKALRDNNCYTYMIARKRNSSISENLKISLREESKTYFLFSSTRSYQFALAELLQESSSYEENFQKLNDTGWLIPCSKSNNEYFTSGELKFNKEGSAEYLEIEKNINHDKTKRGSSLLLGNNDPKSLFCKFNIPIDIIRYIAKILIQIETPKPSNVKIVLHKEDDATLRN